MSQPHPDFSRRRFLGAASAAALGAAAAPVLAADPPKAPEKAPAAVQPPTVKPADKPKPATTSQPAALRIACVGLGGQGRSKMQEALGLKESVVALCDVDERQIIRARKDAGDKLKNPRTYCDYRVLFDEEKDIDAVIIATPDHWHTPLCKLAMKLGKHIYCEKPLTHSVGEARELRELARNSKVMTQLGNQGSASQSLRRCMELIMAGAIGPVREIHTWLGPGGAPCGKDRPEGRDPVTPGFNWDLWLGPVARRPFKAKTYHPYDWRWWYPFGSGQLGDFGCHSFNLPMRALNLGYPVHIDVEGDGLNHEGTDLGCHVQFHFAARGALPPLVIHWHEGKGHDRPDEKVTAKLALTYKGKVPENGVLILGELGQIFTNPWNEAGVIALNADEKFKDVLRHEATTRAFKPVIPRSPGHMAEWFKAIRGEGPIPFSNFDTGGHLTEIVLSGVLALRLGHSIDWDGEKMEVKGDPSAKKFIHPEYRPDVVI